MHTSYKHHTNQLQLQMAENGKRSDEDNKAN